MNLDVGLLHKLCSENKIVWREHALQRMKERKIRREDVKNCICSGEIIEEYPNDYPYPSCLIVGFDTNKRVLHVVCSSNDDILCIITAYHPNNIKWQDDYKTRKAEEL